MDIGPHCVYGGGPQSLVRFRDKHPRHEVCVDDFWPGRYEVINKQHWQFRPVFANRDYGEKDINGDDQLHARSEYRDKRAIFLELYRRHLPGRRSMSSLVANLGIGVSAFSQNHKRLGAQMETDPPIRKRFERAESVLNDGEK